MSGVHEPDVDQQRVERAHLAEELLDADGTHERGDDEG
jgi:hypothetical protein